MVTQLKKDDEKKLQAIKEHTAIKKKCRDIYSNRKTKTEVESIFHRLVFPEQYQEVEE